jgi:hypothetical protein
MMPTIGVAVRLAAWLGFAALAACSSSGAAVTPTAALAEDSGIAGDSGAPPRSLPDAGSGRAGSPTDAPRAGAAGVTETRALDAGPTKDAQVVQVVSDAGADGVVAPGIGRDQPSPPKPSLGTYNGKAKRDITFTASSLDPGAKLGHIGDTEHGRLDSSTPLKWKLIVLLPGIGGGPGLGTSGWIASQGYHELDIAYDNKIPGAPNKPDPRASDPATVGNTRMNQFDAKGRTPACSDDACSVDAPTLARADCIEERVIKALQHLAKLDPSGGWDWYLNSDGSVRWSDAGLFGYSYGATHAAIISVYVRLGIVVVGSGPWNESHPEASWIRTTSATPGARAYAIYGKQDGRYLDYEAETKQLGWPGPYPFEITTSTRGTLPSAAPWYMGSHSILVDDQGHSEFCAQDYSECLYAFDGQGQ